ncbi:MAG TPA: CRISPR-associated protein Csx14 [Chloroflexus aurantiacus]|uniref:CRISPR system ring nuclease SSO2081-like domain-containing protein n=1 Tax=Chloroflexus aurantiacus (strain ATCC 29366 / DSM 635 / J-10-fl) TaxID=324602 RepID=A9WGH8_CHLAA|nr:MULTISPECIES: CRISPR-associated protein Csx14 [Chloroflexus]ABY35510.1 conserved hypothetical protein [Chloroflexus aurantiacus J-10-fl]GIV92046.1 MAG: hypothetical protein KatS3mg056_0755 [Chloroflexus sp.]HBW69463.1 CRISPR-associated protein Csx14 [Chloroflexus aurantiacus]
MSKKLLIATLGTAPAVITEAIELLEEQSLHPDGVVLLYTEDYDVLSSLELLMKHLPAHCEISWIVPISVGTYHDIDSTKAAVEFMQIACTQLRTYRNNHRLFVSIAGGRKVMSALLALAVQFYGAECLFHIWVPPWLEEEGEIGQLRGLQPEQINARLHPPLVNRDPKDRPQLVDLPFIALFPMLPDIREALAGGTPIDKNVKSMLVSTGLLTTDGTPTPLGESVAAILNLVEALPPARQIEPKVHISSHHYKDRIEGFAKELIGYAPFVVEVRGEQWGQGEPGVSAQQPRDLIVRARLGTDIRFQLRLVTTATTEGELEAARRHVERYVQRKER